MSFQPRPKQAEVLTYRRGKMGVAAVPGAGKTRTLSYLAAQLVAQAGLRDDQEVLVVTLVNSAVGNFERQLAHFVREWGLLPGFGYRVRTLHSLAGEIVRDRPGLLGLDEQFVIVDEREANEILQDAVDAWLRAHPGAVEAYLAEEHLENQRARNDGWPRAMSSTAAVFIKQAKSDGLDPETLRERLHERDDLPLARWCTHIYADYQRGLQYRGAVDFQDLIRLGLRALQLDASYLARLQDRWPYILEDEAQDSDAAQEAMLRLLVGEAGNWVRVGDPNQAIYETFTTATPKFLRDFLVEPGVIRRELPNSGRSTRSIIQLANKLIDWTRQSHPVEGVRQREPLSLPHIEPTPQGDPQPNPDDHAESVRLRPEDYTVQDEQNAIVQSLKAFLKQHPDQTVAVLVPRNQRGFEVVQALKAARLDYVEMLRSTSTTREIAGALGNVLNYLGDTHDPKKLSTLYRVWRRDAREDPDDENAMREIARVLERCPHVEDYLWPNLVDWLAETVSEQDDPGLYRELSDFRALVRRWQGAALLPVDQLMLTVAADLFHSAADLATAYSMALYLRHHADAHPEDALPGYTAELARVAKNERKFLGMGEDDMGFDPDRHKGKVTVATMHSAKGLEWDRVYLMSVNSYDFPSALPGDTFIGEKWFARDQLNLDAEARAQLEAARTRRVYQEGDATREARHEYAAERLRLLYVGITRARRELIVTWNTGRRGDQREAAPLVALRLTGKKGASKRRR